MKQSKILVLGANGKTGRKVAVGLKAKGHDVKIGSRSAEPSFDWNDRHTWQAALEGIEKVYITYQPDLAVPAALESITAFARQAVESGVEKLVLLSGRGEKEAQMAEEAVMAAGAEWTIVRADWFFQNFSESFFLDPILAGHVALPRAETKIAFVDTGDIADVAIEALTDDHHNGKIYELTGPRMLTLGEAVGEIAAATGREITFQPISLEEYMGMLQDFQLPGRVYLADRLPLYQGARWTQLLSYRWCRKGPWQKGQRLFRIRN